MIKSSLAILVTLPLLIFAPHSQAIDEQFVRDKARTVYGLYLTPHEAWNMKKQQGSNVLLVDIRARGELKYVGAPQIIDANIPYRFLDPDYAWSDQSETFRTRKNPDFIADVGRMLKTKNADKSTPIILMCTSGTRAPKAAHLLHQAGYQSVYSIYQGFEGVKAKEGLFAGSRSVNGWKNAGLPWSYKLNVDAMYFNFSTTAAAATD